MTSGECFENKWFYMKYIGKYISVEILLTRECSLLCACGPIRENVRDENKNVLFVPWLVCIYKIHRMASFQKI